MKLTYSFVKNSVFYLSHSLVRFVKQLAFSSPYAQFHTSFVIIFAGALILFPIGAGAVNPVPGKKVVTLDEATTQRGYTMVRKEFSVGLPAGNRTGAGKFVTIKKTDYPELPEYLEVVSPVFWYNIRIGAPGYSAKPIWLSYTTVSAPEHRRSFYYYDSRLQEWRALPTSFDTNATNVRAAWHFTNSLVVVADDTRYDFGPQQVSGYTWLGDVNAASAIVIDAKTGQELYGKNINDKRSIASLTKLMTAYILVQKKVDWEKSVTYHSYHNQIGARLYLQEGDVVRFKDLLFAMTVGSANNAAYALVEAAGMTVPDFVNEMNATAQRLGLTNTTFADPSGLNPNNQSTVADYAKFTRIIMRDFTMYQLTAAPRYGFITKNTGVLHDFDSTTQLFRTSSLRIMGTKTGYLDEALYTQTLKAKQDDKEVITVIFGAPTSYTRFAETERLTRWAFANYNW